MSCGALMRPTPCSARQRVPALGGELGVARARRPRRPADERGQVRQAARRVQAADHRERRAGGRSARTGTRRRSCSRRSARRRRAGPAPRSGPRIRRYPSGSPASRAWIAAEAAGAMAANAPSSASECRCAVALDQPEVVEVVAGEQRAPCGSRDAQRDLVVGVEQAHLDAARPRSAFSAMMREDRVDAGRHVGRRRVAGELRVERGAQPVQHHRCARRREHLAVDVQVVGRPTSRPGRGAGWPSAPCPRPWSSTKCSCST